MLVLQELQMYVNTGSYCLALVRHWHSDDNGQIQQSLLAKCSDGEQQ